MSADAFIDTNVLLYVLAASSPEATRAEEILQSGAVVSVQVLNEFANVGRKKFGMTVADIRDVLEAIRKFCTVQNLDIATHELGLDIAERYGFSVYDSMLLAAAQKANCSTFFSEDMQHGQRIGGLTIRNPFKP
jgi:predicted nucleic acid-binding protein